MSIIAKNDEELWKFLIKQMEPVVAEIGEKIKELWTEYIQSQYYDMYIPTKYKRTYQLLNSVVTVKPVVSGNRVNVEIFMDESTATLGYGGFDITYAWDLAAQGYHGQKTDDMRTEGRFFESINEDLKSGLLFSEFEKILKKKGFDVKKE